MLYLNKLKKKCGFLVFSTITCFCPLTLVASDFFGNSDIAMFCTYIPQDVQGKVGGMYRVELKTYTEIPYMVVNYAYHHYGDMVNGYKTDVLEGMQTNDVRRYFAHILFPIGFDKLASNVFVHLSYNDKNISVPCIQTTNLNNPLTIEELEPVVSYGQASSVYTQNKFELNVSENQSLDSLLKIIESIE